MIEPHFDTGSKSGFLVLRPNQSMSWLENRRWMLLLSMLTLGLALLFALRGMWPILVAAVLQLIWLWAAIYKVALDCQQRECVQFTDGEIVIVRGRYRPQEELHLPRYWTRLVLKPGPPGHASSRLMLRCYGRETELGHYLAENERMYLANVIRPYLDLPPHHA